MTLEQRGRGGLFKVAKPPYEEPLRGTLNRPPRLRADLGIFYARSHPA